MTISKPVHLITLDPGHFHAALVQKSMYDDVDSIAHIYAPEGDDLKLHLDRVHAFNTRVESPTRWKNEIYTGADFLEKMIAEKKGNVVVLSGNNQNKAAFILKSLQNGFHVFADKPMAIDNKGFEQLKEAFTVAEKNKLVLYDIMTGRFDINNILQREISLIPEIFGNLEKGTTENPAVIKESVHHFYKYVSGKILTRPSWFMDVQQQGEGIVDVMTHLVDMVQWECFPGQVIDYIKDIKINTAKRWATDMNLSEFKAITRAERFPTYLEKSILNDTLLQVFCNGEINYTIKDIHAKTSVTWNYAAPDGMGDTHYSIIRGSKSNLIIRQGKEENFNPTLYIEPVMPDTSFASLLSIHFKKLSEKYPGIELFKSDKGWGIKIPDRLAEGHEMHFSRVMEAFLGYLKNKNLPKWEVPNMLAKYYTTTKALEIATSNFNNTTSHEK